MEIYAVGPDQLRKVIEMNRVLRLKSSAPLFAVKSEKDYLYEKYGIKPPEEWEVEKIIQESLGNSEFFAEIKKEDILAKYGIRKPSEEEIEAIISNAFGEAEKEEEVEIKPILKP